MEKWASVCCESESYTMDKYKEEMTQSYQALERDRHCIIFMQDMQPQKDKKVTLEIGLI